MQAEHLKPALAVVEEKITPARTCRVKEIRSMVEHFKVVPDFRRRFESYPLWSMLSNNPSFSHPLRCATRAEGSGKVCPGLESGAAPGSWYPAQRPGQVSGSDTADLLSSAPTRRCPQGRRSHFGHSGAGARSRAQGAFDRLRWQATQAWWRHLSLERGHRAKPALHGQRARRPKNQRDSRGARVV